MILISLILLVFFLTAGIASAGHRRHFSHRHHSHFGIFISPPFISVGPPVYYRPYYPYYRAYPPEGYGYGYRVWAPGFWEERWTPYGWEKVWVPGYWRYEY